MREGTRHSYLFKSFRLDAAERRLLHDGKPVPLAPREFEVLVLLVENAGHLVAKDDLLETVWAGSFVDEANIARVIHNLRRALGESESGNLKFIETVAKRGYRFVADVVPAVSESDAPDALQAYAGGNRPRAAPPGNAFQACQLARYHFNQMTPTNLMQSRVFLEEAIRLDPGYAPAYSALAEQTVQEVVAGLRPPYESYPEAKRALERAHDLDPSSAEYYTAAGFVGLRADWDFAGAEYHLRMALDLNPDHPFATSCLGEVFMFQGRTEEAARYLRKAADRDPMNLSLRNLLPISLFLARQYQKSVDECERMLTLYPGFLIAEWIRCWALEQMGKADEALARYKVLLGEPHGDVIRRWIGYAHAVVGDRAAALDAIALLDAEARSHYLSPTHQAQAYAGLADGDNSVNCLEAGIKIRDPWMLWVATDPRYDKVRSHPGFREIVERVIGPKEYPPDEAIAGTRLPGYRVSGSGAHAIVDIGEWRATMERAAANKDGFRKSVDGAAGWRPLLSRRRLMAGAAVVLLAVIAIGSWVASTRPTSIELPIMLNAYKSERLSTDGKVSHLTMSPNGKLVVYFHHNADDTVSIWLRNLETGHNREILPPSRELYFGLEFSPDGDWLYFVRRSRGDGPPPANVYRLSIHGGVPDKVISDTQGWLSISPDGSRIGFVRCHYSPEDNCSLFVADSSNGGNELKLVTRPRPYRIRDLDFSPDGRSIVFATGQSENEGLEFSLSVLDLDTNTQRDVSPERFFNITGVAWLSDLNTILMTASRGQARNSRIWRISLDTGRAERLTKDTASYISLSLDNEASKLVSTHYEDDFRIRLLNWDKPRDALVLPRAAMMSFGTDGRLYYTSLASEDNEIWCINADGSGKKQLTSDPSDDTRPVASPDGTTIYFASNRSGSTHVWRMNSDGSDQSRVTQETGGFPIGVSPDGEWVYYNHETNRSLWRVRANGSEEQPALDTQKNAIAISPDGRSVAYVETVNDESVIVIVSLLTSRRIDQLRPADQDGKLLQIAWMPDGKSLAYVVSKNEVRNNTVWLHRLDAPERPRKMVEIDQTIHEAGGFAVSPDGKTFAVSQGNWLHDGVLFTGLK